MQIDAIENLAAKYLELGGQGRLDRHRTFIRQPEGETEEATALWQQKVEMLSENDRRKFEFLVEELRLGTN